MNCEQIQSLLPDYWQNALDDRSLETVKAHLATCDSCRLDAEMWARLETLPAESPNEALGFRLREILAAYRVGKDHAGRDFRPRRSFLEWLRSWWPAQPVAQLALTSAALLLGLAAGFALARNSRGSRELADLRRELRSTRELVAVSLLRQDSASDRLRGVNYSYRISQPDQEVVAALLQALRYDPAVDVRLSALDALRRFSAHRDVRAALRGSAENDESPMVQVAAIDSLIDLRDAAALPLLQRISRSNSVNPVVRQRVLRAQQLLQETR